MASPTRLTPLRSETPTVTLEVMAREAAVSQWSERPVAEVLRYHLQIRSPTEPQSVIEIRGDRTTFLALEHAIAGYWAGTEDLSAAENLSLTPAITPSFLPTLPRLEPVGLTQYRLHLGNLQTTTGAQEILLGAVQLADLAVVLAQLDAQVRWLPVSLHPRSKRAAWQVWGTAAAGIVAAVGLTTTLWPSYQLTQRGEVMNESALPDEEVGSSVPAAEEAARSPTAPTDPRPLPDPQAGSAISSPPVPAAADSVASSPGSRSVPFPQGEPSPTPAAPKPIAPVPAESVVPAGEVPPAMPRDQNPAQTAPTSPVEDSPQAAIAEAESADSMEVPPPSDGRVTEGAGAATPSHRQGAIERSQPAPMTSLDLSPDADLVAVLQTRWDPPTDLVEPLRYRLDIAADGTLAAIVPLDERSAAEQFRSLPAVGTALVPPGEARSVWVLLYPKGQVTLQASPPEPDP